MAPVKTASPIFEAGRGGSYLFALAIVLILALCTLIAATAFAATEAEPAATTTECNGYYEGRGGERQIKWTVIIPANLKTIPAANAAEALKVLSTARAEFVKISGGAIDNVTTERVICPLADGTIEITLKKH